MSDTGFDGQGITAGTELILSPARPASARVSVHPDPQGHPARPGVFHRPDQQRPHAAGLPERRATHALSGTRARPGPNPSTVLVRREPK